MTGKTHMSNNREQHIIIPGFQPAKSHAISVTSVSEGKRSTPYVFSCVTDPRGEFKMLFGRNSKGCHICSSVKILSVIQL